MAADHGQSQAACQPMVVGYFEKEEMAMKFFWLNDAVTIQAENSDERNALKIFLEGVLKPNGTTIVATESSEVTQSFTPV